MDTLSASALFSTHTPQTLTHTNTHMCTHTRRITNYSPNYGRTHTWVFAHTHGGGNGKCHTREHTHAEIQSLKCVHICTERHTHTCNIHTQTSTQSPWTVIDMDKEKLGGEGRLKVWSRRERERKYFIYQEPSALGMWGLAKERGFTL